MVDEKAQNKNGSAFWMKYFPYLFVGAMLTANYLTGVKLVQLGIPDLGSRVCSVPHSTLNLLMALMAIIACITGILSGILLNKIELKFKKRLYILLMCFVIQGGITFVGGFLSNPTQFTIWIIMFSVVLGFLLCQPFVFLFMLIPRKHTGIFAGVVTGLAYLVGNLSMFDWTFQGLSMETIIVTLPLGFLIILALFNMPKLSILDFTIDKERDYNGKYGEDLVFWVLVLLMFGVYFVDSFGFLRMKREPYFMELWGGYLSVKVWLGIAHLISAVFMGYLYQKAKFKGPLVVFISSFGGFVVVDLLFSFYPNGSLLFISALLYCCVVSFYTINSFAIWADVSNSKNISSRAGIGIAVGGWLSSFLSTALTEELVNILPGTDGYATHLRISAIISLNFLLISLLYLRKLKK